MISMGRNRPVLALRSILAILKNPDDLPRVFDLIASLPGRSAERMLTQFQASAESARLLAPGGKLGVLLRDRAALLALPEGSLGRAYAEFAERAGISAEGIVDASSVSSDWTAENGELRFVHERMRDSHDLWHTVTGYGADALGEAGLLSFLLAQNWHPGIGLLVGALYLRALAGGVPEVNRVVREGYRRGKKAAYLPAVVWEDLLARPIDEVRALLRVGEPAVYEPMTTAALRAAGLIPVEA